uniref:Putative gp67-like protein n=1 Tax=Kallithea virus TaxID=1654582 RepID=A0A0F7KMU9_9VIRU|nr:putative gp67-like protein [Kallithea virus]
MNSSDAFLKAALYEQCSKSAILKHVDLDNTDTETLRNLINRNNTLSIRKIPILISKFVTRAGIQFAVTKFPNLHNYIRPEHIQVRIEEDELAYLLNKDQDLPVNIVLIVIKNIALSMLGTSIETFATDLNNLNSKTETENKNTTVADSTHLENAKIGNIKVVRDEDNNLEHLNITPPRAFTSQFDGRVGLDRSKSVETTRSMKSTSSVNKIKQLKRLNSKTSLVDGHYPTKHKRSPSRQRLDSASSSISSSTVSSRRSSISAHSSQIYRKNFNVEPTIETLNQNSNAMIENDQTKALLDELLQTTASVSTLETAATLRKNQEPIEIIENVIIRLDDIREDGDGKENDDMSVVKCNSEHLDVTKFNADAPDFNGFISLVDDNEGGVDNCGSHVEHYDENNKSKTDDNLKEIQIVKNSPKSNETTSHVIMSDVENEEYDDYNDYNEDDEGDIEDDDEYYGKISKITPTINANPKSLTTLEDNLLIVNDDNFTIDPEDIL